LCSLVFCIALNSGCWTGVSDVHGFDGVPRDLPLDECFAVCISNRSCVAIDWEPLNAGRTCWILTSDVTRETMTSGVITNYQLNRACLSKLNTFSAGLN